MQRFVYIVDDDPLVRKSLGWIVRELGFEFRPFASGSDFLEAVGHLSPGCVLLDMRMPGLDGMEVLERFTAFQARFPTIMMTGHGDVGSAVHAMKLGATDFLQKPFGTDALQIALDGAMSKLAPRTDDTETRIIDSFADVLTARQLDVLRQMIVGQSNKEIAVALDIAPRTVEMHRANLMAKLGVRNLAGIARLMMESKTADDAPLRKSA